MKKRYLILANAASDKNLIGSIVCEAKGTKATFKLRGYIGGEKCNPDVLAMLIDEAIAKGAKTAAVHLSSQGGSVYDANDMVADLERFGNENVTVYVGALAASAATRFCTAFKTVCRSNSQFMIHKPSAGAYGNEKDMENGLKRLKDVTDEYRTAYAAKMGKSEAEIETLWADGDKWLTAKEAKEMKLVDSVDPGTVTIDEETNAMLIEAKAPNYTPPKNVKPYMEREKLIALLGLEATATDAQIESALKAKQPSQNQNQTMDKTKLIASLGLDANATEAQIEAKLAEIKQSATAHDTAKKEAENQQKATAEADVDAAIRAKKILATQRDNYVKMYLAAPAETKAALENLPEGKALSAELDKTKTGTDPEASREKWTLQDYLDKDPKALTALEKGNPERFNQLNKDYFGS